MIDIVEHLRYRINRSSSLSGVRFAPLHVLRDAADEIERLREANIVLRAMNVNFRNANSDLCQRNLDLVKELEAIRQELDELEAEYADLLDCDAGDDYVEW